jgi:hypothetical protein
VLSFETSRLAMSACGSVNSTPPIMAIFTAAGFSSLMTPLITRPSFMVKRLSW